MDVKPVFSPIHPSQCFCDISGWTKEETGPKGTQYLCRKMLERAEDANLLRFFKNNSGAAGGLSFGKAGWPDYIVCRLGFTFGVECKGYKHNRPTKLRESQNALYPMLLEHMPVIAVHDPVELFEFLTGKQSLEDALKKTRSMLYKKKPKKSNASFATKMLGG